MTKLNRMMAVGWGAQALAEQEAWHDSSGSFKTDRERTAFRAAYTQAWLECLNTLKLHGHVELTDIVDQAREAAERRSYRQTYGGV